MFSVVLMKRYDIVPKSRALYCTRPISLLRLYGLNSKPYGVNYIARYTLCLREGIRSTFTQDVVGAIHISTDRASIFGAVQTVSPPDALSAKDMLLFIVGCVGRNRVKIKKAGFAGIALFSHFDLDTH